MEYKKIMRITKIYLKELVFDINTSYISMKYITSKSQNHLKRSNPYHFTKSTSIGLVQAMFEH